MPLIEGDLMGLFDLKDKTESEEELDRLLESLSVDIGAEKIDYKELTIEQIDEIPSDELVKAVCVWINGKMDDGEEYGISRTETLKGLPEPCGFVYSIKLLIDEFEKNGFNKFYENPKNAEYMDFAIEGFRTLGEYDLTEICERSAEKYKKLYKKHGEKYFSGFLIDYGNNALTELDFEFETIIEKKDLNRILINYIRGNSDDFGD